MRNIFLVFLVTYNSIASFFVFRGNSKQQNMQKKIFTIMDLILLVYFLAKTFYISPFFNDTLVRSRKWENSKTKKIIFYIFVVGWVSVWMVGYGGSHGVGQDGGELCLCNYKVYKIVALMIAQLVPSPEKKEEGPTISRSVCSRKCLFTQSRSTLLQVLVDY